MNITENNLENSKNNFDSHEKLMLKELMKNMKIDDESELRISGYATILPPNLK